MRKVFLYLYPIKEFVNMFLLHDDNLYDELNIPRPLPILNDTIDKRYRKKGYQVVFVLYPDKELYGIEKCDGDKIIYTDIPFSEASAYDSEGNEKKNFTPKYPNEIFLIKQLGSVDELVIGGYHVMDCVKRVAELALQSDISTLVDLDLTDLFFNVYKQNNYFNIEEYSPERFKMNLITRNGTEESRLRERIFDRNYSSPVYGFNKEKNDKIRR